MYTKTKSKIMELQNIVDVVGRINESTFLESRRTSPLAVRPRGSITPMYYDEPPDLDDPYENEEQIADWIYESEDLVLKDTSISFYAKNKLIGGKSYKLNRDLLRQFPRKWKNLEDVFDFFEGKFLGGGYDYLNVDDVDTRSGEIELFTEMTLNLIRDKKAEAILLEHLPPKLREQYAGVISAKKDLNVRLSVTVAIADKSTVKAMRGMSGEGIRRKLKEKPFLS